VHVVAMLLAMGILFTPRWLAQSRYRRNMARLMAREAAA